MEAGDGQAIVRVRDSGPGIPTDQLPHIFSRVRQGRRAGRRGIGLSLAIARGIVHAHGGRIWAESVPGASATFNLSILFAAVKARTPEESAILA